MCRGRAFEDISDEDLRAAIDGFARAEGPHGEGTLSPNEESLYTAYLRELRRRVRDRLRREDDEDAGWGV